MDKPEIIERGEKATELGSLEAFVKVRVIEIDRLRENNESMDNLMIEIKALEFKIMERKITFSSVESVMKNL